MVILHPAYFPNSLFFSALIKNDVIWEAHDNFQKQTYRNRAFICTDRGLHMLSIPIVHTRDKLGRQLYREVKIDNSYPWQRQHWRTLETAYRTSPFFEFYEDELKSLYMNTFDFLLDFNLMTIQTICECLQVKMPSAKTEDYKKMYTDKEDFRPLVNAKATTKYKHPEYTQVFGDRHSFIPNLSILDVIFNEGPNTTALLNQIRLS
ncbi:WbqC family protein [Maribacter sp. CXY002]|uniref:WbqC family protein n=1 Tax=Maribacter luteocoastalis TaxID=3407671 RepID=UPI003B6772BE